MSMTRQEALYDAAIENGELLECGVCGKFRDADKMEGCEACKEVPICPRCFKDTDVCNSCSSPEE